MCNKACELQFFVQGMHRIADLPRTGLDTVLRVAAQHIGLIEVAYTVPHTPAHTRTHRACTLAHTTSEKIEGPIFDGNEPLLWNQPEIVSVAPLRMSTCCAPLVPPAHIFTALTKLCHYQPCVFCVLPSNFGKHCCISSRFCLAMFRRLKESAWCCQQVCRKN